MTAKPQLTIVVLSYNVQGLLLDCLKSLFASQKPRDLWHVIVVDNASSDGSVAAVKSHFPQVELIVNSKNLGFAAGNNVALKKISSEFTLLLNPDTLVYPRSIQTVLEFLVSHPDYAAATCRVELPDGSLDYSSHRGFPKPWNSFIHLFTGLESTYALSAKNLKEIHDIDALTGAFALVRTESGRQVGWLDEDYYWNGEDLDFCYKLKLAGWKIAFIPTVKITHFKGSSSGLYKNGSHTLPPRTSRVKAVVAGTDAMRIFYQKHYSSHYPVIFNWFIYLGIGILRLFRLMKIYISNA